MKKLLWTALLALLALCLCASALGAESGYRTLKRGDSGPDVTRLKEAMYWLGYFSSQNVSDMYNATTEERVKQLQRNNGLPATGEADAELQALIYSGECVKTASAPAASPVPSAQDDTPFFPADYPAVTEAGFLSPDAEIAEYVYADKEKGVWLYLSASLAIDIRRRTDAPTKNTWFECDIRNTADSPLNGFVNWNNKRTKTVSINPQRLSRRESMVLLLSDDYFGNRQNSRKTMGIIIRGGEIISDKTVKAGSTAFPNLDVLALFEDGSMKTFPSDAHTAQEYLDMGVTDTFAFGPILVTDGRLGDMMTDRDYFHYREPRLAFGMIAPHHYLAIITNGRGSKNAQGVYLSWLADKMLEKGAKEAINLDGGGTTALFFMGERLNATGSSARELFGCIAFGTSEQVPKK